MLEYLSLLMSKIAMYMAFPFVRYAITVGVLIALCSSLFGLMLVLRGFSYIGEGLSHLAFGLTSILTALSFVDNTLIVLIITVFIALLLLKSGRDRTVRNDAVIAMMSVGALAAGYLSVNVFSSSSNVTADVCTTLFGSTSILTLSLTDVYLSIALSVIVILVYIYMYNRIFAISFDEDFMTATGMNTSRINLILALIIAVIIVLALKLVGSLLISALLIFPAISAMRLFKTFLSVSIAAAVISVFSALVGMLVAILFGTPVGSSIVMINVFIFIVFSLIGFLTKLVRFS